MMNKNILQNIISQSTQFSLFIATFFLPLKTSFSNLGLIILIASTFFSFIINGIDFKRKKIKLFLFFSSFILTIPLFLGYFYSPFLSEAQEEIRKYLFLILLPILIFRKDLYKLEIKPSLQAGLIVGTLISCIGLTFINILKFYNSGQPLVKYFSSHYTGFNFLSPLNSDLHPIYMGSYYCMAMSIILLSKKVAFKKLRAIATIILVIGIISLNSRVIFLCVFILMFLVAIENLSWKVFAVITTTLIIGIALIMPFFQKTYVYNKLVNGTVWELNENIGTHNTDTKTTSDSRMSRWTAGWELIKERPLFGYGTGTENEYLLKKYKDRNMKLSIEKKYNAHNQFLGFFIRFGLIGLIVLLVYFGVNFYLAFRSRDLVYISFLILILTIFLIENYIDRNMGINLVALLGTIFLIKDD